MPVLSLGISYRRAPIELLERLAFSDDDLAKAYRRLGDLASVRGAVLLSTCNRVEVHAEVTAYHQGFQELKRFLAESRDVEADHIAEPLYSHYDDDAVEHVFAVASGLDSMVVGEPQILGQVRESLKRAEAEGAATPVLSDLFRQATRVGRRVRAETAVGSAPAAFVEAGAVPAAGHLGGLAGRSLLVVGAGQMGALAVRALREHGIGPVRILNRTPARAAKLAEQVGGDHGGLDALPESLAEADLVVSSTGATGTVIDRSLVEQAGRRPQFFMDLAVPRDVDPSVRDVAGVGVADIEDLRGHVVGGPDGELKRARSVVTEEVERYAARRRAAKMAPLIQALRSRGEEIREGELRRLSSRLASLSTEDRETVEALTRGIVNKLLHEPVVRVKDLDREHARLLAALFGLELRDEA
ncbi:MAG TPA: glutamyl-tRNA reductase [Actinomycetota bacterium]|nr:glutamyl-tRNA reductase [Actinomycetota bacterium]